MAAFTRATFRNTCHSLDDELRSDYLLCRFSIKLFVTILPRNSDLSSGASVALAVMEDSTWYVHFVIEKRKGGVLLEFVELSYGTGFLLICERRTTLARLRMLYFFILVLMCMYNVFIFLHPNVILRLYLIVFLKF